MLFRSPGKKDSHGLETESCLKGEWGEGGKRREGDREMEREREAEIERER